MGKSWEQTFKAARVKLVTREGYYAEPLFSLRVRESPGLGTFAVTDRGVLLLDPDRVIEWGADGVAAALSHEVGHWLRDHAGRRGSRDAWLWNVAGDAEINDDVVKAGWKLPVPNPIMPSSLGAPDGLTAEEYYGYAKKKADEQGKGLPGQPKPGEGQGGKGLPMGPDPKAGPGSWGDCGGCAHGEKHDADKDGAGEGGMDPTDVDLMRRSVAESVRQHEQSFGRGSVPAGLSVWAGRTLAPPVIDWRKQLRCMVRRMVASKQGADVRTWSRLSSRYWAMRHVSGAATPPRPSTYSPVPKVAVVVDTSGSMQASAGTRTRLDLGLSEVLGVVKAVGVPVTVYAVDAEVQARVAVRHRGQMEKVAVGGGGTDMTMGVMVAAQEQRPDVVVLITDGETGWPAPGQFPRSTRLVIACVTDAEVPPHLPLVVRVKE